MRVNSTIRLLLIFFLLYIQLILTSCETVTPYVDAQDAAYLTQAEQRLWSLSEKFDQTASQSGHLYKDEALQGYLQQIVDRLYPEFQGSLRVHILKSPALNAFVLPNGSIYVHTSLIARFDNEAQAATVLGHESAHFVSRHSLRQTQNVKWSTAFANALSLSGIPLVGPVLAASSISGYSKSMENEADEIAFQRLLASGYDTSEAVAIFRKMADETKALNLDEPFFFSTHPRMRERVAHFEAMHGTSGGDKDFAGTQRYLQVTMPVRIASLEEDLAMGRFKSVLLALEPETALEIYPAYTRYHLGEAYRLRSEKGDNQRAFEAYSEAVEVAPEYAPSYRALGYHYLKRKQEQKALEYFEMYLQRAPEAGDQGYVRFQIEKIRGRTK